MALAISSEEDDARIYSGFAQQLRAEYPDSAALFSDMAKEEDAHRQQLIALHETQFGAFQVVLGGSLVFGIGIVIGSG